MSQGNGNGGAPSGVSPFPEGVNCGSCAYGVATQATDVKGAPVIGETVIHCMRFPPAMVFRVGPDGQAQLGPMFPLVLPQFACFSHSFYDGSAEETE